MDHTHIPTLVALGLVNCLFGFLIGRFRLYQDTRAIYRRAKDEAWRIIEEEQLANLRWQATDLGLTPENDVSEAGISWEQAPPMPESLRNLIR